LAADNVAFAYIKATEGADHVDTRFDYNWREAEAAGLYRGAYHFFTLCQPGARQASNFIAVVPRVEGALPAAVDLEHMGPCREGPTMPDVIAEARIFMDRLEAHYGVRPIIYTTREFHDAHLAELQSERFWIRSHRQPAELPPARLDHLAASQSRSSQRASTARSISTRFAAMQPRWRRSRQARGRRHEAPSPLDRRRPRRRGSTCTQSAN
jgi:GH25 family lysozyme M1 (1,4-beta-N-acetylmuramidase)